MSTITDSITPLELVSTLNGAITDISTKQDILVAGDNIKTVNSISILGDGNLEVASASQGSKADTALQPEDVTSTYSASGTSPINGIGVAGALGTLSIPVITDTYDSTSQDGMSGIAVAGAISNKQDSLVSGSNIKTINGNSVLGSGNIELATTADQTYSPTSTIAQSGTAVAQALEGKTLVTFVDWSTVTP